MLSSVILLLISPLLLLIALGIKISSRGPALFRQRRYGLNGNIVEIWKFRTMTVSEDGDHVVQATRGDARVTRFGAFLRRHSLDELPQFVNVLRGEMSVVGPRPPLAGEVGRYDLSHLRRLDVMPGITGLWQVQARQDPSFDSYVSLDVTYIEHWSVWLNLKIVLRTIAVVLAGTGV